MDSHQTARTQTGLVLATAEDLAKCVVMLEREETETVNVDGKPADFFLLYQPSMGGCSGAPVFVVPQLQLTDDGQLSIVKPRCVGLVSRTISDETGGQFAAVVPAAAIRRAMARARR